MNIWGCTLHIVLKHVANRISWTQASSPQCPFQCTLILIEKVAKWIRSWKDCLCFFSVFSSCAIYLKNQTRSFVFIRFYPVGSACHSFSSFWMAERRWMDTKYVTSRLATQQSAHASDFLANAWQSTWPSAGAIGLGGWNNLVCDEMLFWIYDIKTKLFMIRRM